MATKGELPYSSKEVWFDVGISNDITVETTYIVNNGDLFISEYKVLNKEKVLIKQEKSDVYLQNIANKSIKEKRIEQFKNLLQVNLIEINSGLNFNDLTSLKVTKITKLWTK